MKELDVFYLAKNIVGEGPRSSSVPIARKGLGNMDKIYNEAMEK